MIVFDPDKDASNLAKHGVSLRLAEVMDLGAAFIRRDERKDYREARFNAYGYIDGLYALTFAVRGEDVRAISLRRARPKELRQWRSRN